MTDDPRPVQAELMLPRQLSDALAHRPLAFLPLGTIEWHSYHLPIGLDGLTAHGLCVRAAQRAGGIVLPTLFYGTGGGHSAYPWTVMIDDASVLRTLLETSLIRLQDFGVRAAVLFTGHFPDEQLAMIQAIAREWPADAAMSVTALSINGNAAAGLAADHAGMFETTLLAAISPQLVQLDQLPSRAAAPADDPDGNDQGAHRHAPGHPLYGVFGPDPRGLDPAAAGSLLEGMTSWLVAETADVMRSELVESR